MARGTVADALPRLSLRSPAELHAARGGTVAPRDLATLPASTRVLLKRREVAEVERQLQTQRQVRAAPAPRALQVCRGDKGAGGVSPAPRGLGAGLCTSGGRCSRHPAIPQEFQQRMQRLAQRRQQLARRQEQHRGAVLRFDSFLKVPGWGPGPGGPEGAR